MFTNVQLVNMFVWIWMQPFKALRGESKMYCLSVHKPALFLVPNYVPSVWIKMFWFLSFALVFVCQKHHVFVHRCCLSLLYSRETNMFFLSAPVYLHMLLTALPRLLGLPPYEGQGSCVKPQQGCSLWCPLAGARLWVLRFSMHV